MRLFGILFKVIGGLALAALIAALLGIVVQHLWNWLMPSLFHLPPLSLIQAAGLILLSRILFGHIGGGGHHKRHCGHGHSCCGKAGWEKMGRHKFFRKWSPNGDPSQLEHFDTWWKDGGEASFESSKDACKGGWGWWSWWKHDGKAAYERWIANRPQGE